MTPLNNNAYRSLQQFSLNTNNNGNSTPAPVEGKLLQRPFLQQQLPTVSTDSFKSQANTNNTPATYKMTHFGDSFQFQNGREAAEKGGSSTRVNAVFNSLSEQFPEVSGRDFQKLVQQRLKTKFIT